MQNHPTYPLRVFAQGQSYLLNLIIKAIFATGIAALASHIEQGPLVAHVIAIVGLLVAVSGVQACHVDVRDKQLAFVDLG